MQVGFLLISTIYRKACFTIICRTILKFFQRKKASVLTFICTFAPDFKKKLQMKLRYYNLEIHQINSIHDFHKWGRSCQH